VPLLGTNLSAGRCAIVEGTQRQTGYGGLSLTISRPGGNQGAAGTRFRAVGHRKGSKELLNTSAGLVPTVFRNKLIVRGRLVQSAESTILRSSLEPGSELDRTKELRA
jgi:hypothetical protein